VFAERWRARLPLPFTRADRRAGYWWDISMRQVEVATTITFTAPRHARAFFGALAAGNPDIGRPDMMEIIYGRQVRCVTKGVFRTAVDRDNDGVVVNAFYRHSRIKTCLKDGRALRAGTVINDACSSACCAASSTSASSPPRPVTSTAGCCRLCVPARTASLRAQPLSGSHSPHPPRMAGGPRPCGSASPGSWPWPAPRP
jgi:hypothetical protein